MKRIIFVLAVLTAVVFPAICQENPNKYDIRLGTGVSLMGSGDMIAFNYENELGLKFNKYFTGSLSIHFGRSNSGVFETASFTGGNLNFYISPFRNNRRFDFRIGSGLSYYNVSDVYVMSVEYSGGQLIDIDYAFDERNSFGYNIIIENSYLLTNRFLIGVKLFTQPYFNGDINSGVLLKLGMNI